MQGVDPEMEATALARADMRAKTPSAKVAARAVRSLKKKIARVREWEAMRARGKDLSAEQVSSIAHSALAPVVHLQRAQDVLIQHPREDCRSTQGCRF